MGISLLTIKDTLVKTMKYNLSQQIDKDKIKRLITFSVNKEVRKKAL